MKKVKIGIMGMGTVGSGVYGVIQKEGAYIAHKEGIELEVKKVLALQYAIDIPDEKKAKDLDDLVQDDEISIIVEVMGGIEPAKTFILKALAAGKTIVSANKELISQYWPELEQQAKATGAGLYFEASVGGGIPILRTVNQSLQANFISSIYGIINGTTNYILTKMADEGRDFEDVLKEAQELGYAEANPTADVDGFDAAYKLSILASMAFHMRLPVEHIHREGIRKVTKEDIAVAKELGMEVKLLAIGKKKGEIVQVRVHPTLIPKDHPLASVKGSFNAIMLHGSAVGDVMFYGRGAGDFPTASAIVSDVICAAKEEKHLYMTFMNEPAKISPTMEFDQDWSTAFYIRLKALDRPGTLAKVTAAFGKHGVNLHSVLQKDTDGQTATVIFVTGETKELAVRDAMEELNQLEEVLEISNYLRVEC